MLVLSDLFNEKTQFEWLFSTLLEFYQHHYGGEDEITNQYTVVTLCKAAAVLQQVSLKQPICIQQVSLYSILPAVLLPAVHCTATYDIPISHLLETADLAYV